MIRLGVWEAGGSSEAAAPPTAELVAKSPGRYLVADEVIDFSAPAVIRLGAWLWHDADGDEVEFARLAFEFVRDEIAHSLDVGDHRVMITASETLGEGVGLCFAKAHLLVALLRVRGVPAGLCYQRLRSDGGQCHQVHGLVAVYLEEGWHRQDPRGNKSGIEAEFSLTGERLAWSVRPELGERDYVGVYVYPHSVVLSALRTATDVFELYSGGLLAEL
jgi:transglutaminase-like putative cysteine protease